jgi:hypothetical protein
MHLANFCGVNSSTISASKPMIVICMAHGTPEPVSLEWVLFVPVRWQPGQKSLARKTVSSVPWNETSWESDLEKTLSDHSWFTLLLFKLTLTYQMHFLAKTCGLDIGHVAWRRSNLQS